MPCSAPSGWRLLLSAVMQPPSLPPVTSDAVGKYAVSGSFVGSREQPALETARSSERSTCKRHALRPAVAGLEYALLPHELSLSVAGLTSANSTPSKQHDYIIRCGQTRFGLRASPHSRSRVFRSPPSRVARQQPGLRADWVACRGLRHAHAPVQTASREAAVTARMYGGPSRLTTPSRPGTQLASQASCMIRQSS